MAKASSRQELIDYCLRQLGAPVLEVNVDDDQIDDLIDDAIQMFHERIFDGVEKMFLKYKITQDDIDRGLGVDVAGTTTGIGGTSGIGIHTTGVTTSMVNTGITTYGERTYEFYENSNYIQVPDSVVGIEKIFKLNVVKVNIINKKSILKFTRGRNSRVKGFKKAIVTLKKGQSIDLTTGI